MSMCFVFAVDRIQNRSDNAVYRLYTALSKDPIRTAVSSRSTIQLSERPPIIQKGMISTLNLFYERLGKEDGVDVLDEFEVNPGSNIPVAMAIDELDSYYHRARNGIYHPGLERTTQPVIVYRIERKGKGCEIYTGLRPEPIKGSDRVLSEFPPAVLRYVNGQVSYMLCYLYYDSKNVVQRMVPVDHNRVSSSDFQSLLQRTF